jgi:hypothetical protein
MTQPKTAKPAPARHGEPVSIKEHTNTLRNKPKLAELQAPPDDRGESDLAFFRRRPHVNSRTRLPFANELPLAVVELAGGREMFVHVVVERDPVTNEPGTRARGIFFSDIAGGRA